VDRYRWLQAILTRWDDEGWQWKPDTGWGEYDAEVYGPRWSRLRLTTVAEEADGGRKILRCRLAAGSSLRARFVFGTMAGLLFLILESAAVAGFWVWWLMALVPLGIWQVESEKHLIKRLVAASVVTVAEELGLVDQTKS
jgi:hypothetical protein